MTAPPCNVPLRITDGTHPQPLAFYSNVSHGVAQDHIIHGVMQGHASTVTLPSPWIRRHDVARDRAALDWGDDSRPPCVEGGADVTTQ